MHQHGSRLCRRSNCSSGSNSACRSSPAGRATCPSGSGRFAPRSPGRYDLLSEDEQRGFRALGVFVGGCTLTAAEQVAEVDLDLLQSLLDKSLLRRTGERYWMLETIREFALERLGEAGEFDAVIKVYFDFYAELAESAHITADALDEGPRLPLVLPEADNLRAAIDWALAVGEVEAAASLAVSLEQFWVTNSPEEGARRLAALLEDDHELPPLLRARAFRARGGATYNAGNYEEGTLWAEAALAIFRELGDEPRVAHMLIRSAVEASRSGNQERAKALAEESRSLHGGIADQAQAFYVLGDVAFAEGRGEEALELHARSAELAGRVGFDWWRVGSLCHYVEFALRLGRTDGLAEPAREIIAVSRQIGDRQTTVYGITLLAWLAAETGQCERAGRLWGAAEAEAERAPIGQWEAERDDYASHVVRDTATFAHGRSDGHHLSLDHAVEEALAQHFAVLGACGGAGAAGLGSRAPTTGMLGDTMRVVGVRGAG